MRQVTVTIPDVSIDDKASNEVPQWQQEMVLERMKNAKPEDYISWEYFEKEMDEKWLK